MKGAGAGHPEIGLLFSFFLVQLPTSFHIVEVLKLCLAQCWRHPFDAHYAFFLPTLSSELALVTKCGVLLRWGIVFSFYQ